MQKTIDIRTTQNVTIEYELAGLRERALAFLLDFVVLIISFFVLLSLFSAVFKMQWLDDSGWLRAFVFLPLLVFLLYHILFEIMNGGQTIGKKAMGIKVVRLDGKDPEWGDVSLESDSSTGRFHFFCRGDRRFIGQNHAQKSAPRRYGRQYYDHKSG